MCAVEPEVLGARPLSTERHELGEGATWDRRTARLVHVDIQRGVVWESAPTGGARRCLTLDPPVSFAAPRTAGGFVIGQGQRIILVDGQGRARTLCTIDHEPAENRLNDARCDAAGRLWAGTMSTRREPATAGLYRVTPEGEVDQVLSGTTISNGLGWSPDDQLMYFIDSLAYRIDVFDFDLDRGELANRRPFVEIAPGIGMPDGLAVDREGAVWVSLFGGAAVHRYSPEGALLATSRLPTSNPTCPAFGGHALDRVFITSARHRLSDEELRAQPLAGSVFVIDEPGVRGLQPHLFLG